MSSKADLSFAALTVATSMGVPLALAVGLRRARAPLKTALVAGATVLAGTWVWLGTLAVLSAAGHFADPWAFPPRLPLVPVGALLLLLGASRTRVLRSAIEALPLWALTGAQAFRALVEISLWLLYREGRAPVQVTFEGRNWDVLVGVSAPILAWLIARRRVSARAVLAWNVASLLVLANTMATVITSTPGRLHLGWPGAPFEALSRWPILALPAYLAPLAIVLHVHSMRAAWRSRTDASR